MEYQLYLPEEEYKNNTYENLLGEIDLLEELAKKNRIDRLIMDDHNFNEQDDLD